MLWMLEEGVMEGEDGSQGEDKGADSEAVIMEEEEEEEGVEKDFLLP